MTRGIIAAVLVAAIAGAFLLKANHHLAAIHRSTTSLLEQDPPKPNNRQLDRILEELQAIRQSLASLQRQPRGEYSPSTRQGNLAPLPSDRPDTGSCQHHPLESSAIPDENFSSTIRSAQDRIFIELLATHRWKVLKGIHRLEYEMAKGPHIERLMATDGTILEEIFVNPEENTEALEYQRERLRALDAVRTGQQLMAWLDKYQ